MLKYPKMCVYVCMRVRMHVRVCVYFGVCTFKVYRWKKVKVVGLCLRVGEWELGSRGSQEGGSVTRLRRCRGA